MFKKLRIAAAIAKVAIKRNTRLNKAKACAKVLEEIVAENDGKTVFAIAEFDELAKAKGESLNYLLKHTKGLTVVEANTPNSYSHVTEVIYHGNADAH